MQLWLAVVKKKKTWNFMYMKPHPLKIQNVVCRSCTLTLTMLWADSAADKLVIFFLFFLENRTWHFMQIVSLGDKLHEVSDPIF